MTTIRYSANGGFNDTHLYVKYPDFAAPVLVSAGSRPVKQYQPDQLALDTGLRAYEAREEMTKHALRAETSQGLRQVETTGDSRGERSNSIQGKGQGRW